MFKHLINKVTGTSGKLFVHEAEQEDLLTVSEIHGASFNRGWSDGEIEKLLAQDSYSCLVARRQGKSAAKLLGFVVVKKVLDEAEIISIATHPKSRRQGSAKHLLNTVLRQLQNDRVKLLFLEVDEQNRPAIELYKELGFQQVAKRDGYYSQSDSDKNNHSSALVMQLELG